VSLRIALLADHFGVAKEVRLGKDKTKTFITLRQQPATGVCSETDDAHPDNPF
jgi:hypothetical protein